MPLPWLRPKRAITAIREHGMTFDENVNQLTVSDFKFLFNHGKRKKIIFDFDFESLIYCSYWFVKHTAPSLINENKFTELIITIGKERGLKWTKSDIDKYNHKELLQFVFWIADEIGSIAKLEKAYLSSPPDADMVNAGVKELDELGELNVIDILAQGNILKWDKVKKLQYAMVFDKLRKGVIERRVQKRYNEIMTAKKRPKGKK